MSKMQSITDDLDYYHNAFGVFHRVSKRNDVLCHWIDTELREVIKQLRIKATSEGTVRALSIGPGDGEIEKWVLQTFREGLQPSPDHVLTTVVEPAADQTRLFQERMAEEKGIELDCKIQTLQDYQNAAENQTTRFHFISSVHSIYYVPDLQASIKDLYERLEPGGMMMIVVVSDKNGMNKLRERFKDLEKFQQYLTLPTSADIRAACDSLNIPVAKELPIPLRADITACLGNPKDLSEEGLLLLAFLTHVMHFVRDAPQALRRDVLEYLGSDSCSERSQGGTVSFIGDWKALIIQR